MKRVICLILLAVPASSGTIGRLNPPQILKQIVSGAGLILLPLHRKKVSLEDNMADFIYSPKKELTQEEPQIRSRTKDFPWEEYEALEQAFEQGQSLSIQELKQLMQLTTQIKQRELVQPARTKNAPIKSCSVPGMRMAGGGCSKETAVAEPVQTTEQAEQTEFVSVTAQGTTVSAQEINVGLLSGHEELTEQTPSTFSRRSLSFDEAFGPFMESPESDAFGE